MRLMVILLLLLDSTATWAHEVHIPIGKCWVEARDIICEGGESDGHPLPDALVEVIGYDEKTFLSGKLDDHSRISFKRPQCEFYILIDAGPGQVIEIDWKDIKGI
ncbi:hypothetical protein SAMN05192560_1142 [Methylobacillus rhizosphaerae]|uniref:Uncharacterized protein n=1 Tax=Methylobacillus rhizosphaerae TaxID=551994 RepID=A0A238ZAD9_9PROT|nr:hypothetical protein [Methylobacillus rhizosphaerae]SNR79891.1 hypothetical protein SAMN05192560_1142 [Methylobacillus rhizosphaerae]